MESPRYFTLYWKNSTWKELAASTERGELFDHAASDQLRRRGVSPGDFVYAVTIMDGEVWLAGRMRIRNVTGQRDAERQLGRRLWKATDHILGDPGGSSALDFRRKVPPAIARRLKCIIRSGELVPLKINRKRRIDGQSLRPIRELTPASAALLDQLLERAQ
jgi:hypothetical protein